MKKRAIISVSAALLCLVSSVTASAQMRGLKDAYKSYFKVGVAVNLNNISVPEQVRVVKSNFNSMSPENVMKPALVQPYQGQFYWDDADKIANFCRENGIKMRGHCLMWHKQIGQWMFYDEDGKLVSKEILFDRMRTHIYAVVNRYKDVVYAWDVVNEAINPDDNSSEAYRTESRFWEICHSGEWIEKAFQYAREADPDALLFYNEYNECDKIKRDRIYNMVKTMKAKGVPIDGIGMQAHYNINGPSAKEVDATIKQFAKIVDHIHITELDVRLTSTKGGASLSAEERMRTPNISAEDLKKQEDYYVALFDVLRKNRKVIDAVTFWNLADADSWLGRVNAPLLFDFEFRPKQVYRAVMDFDEPDNITKWLR